MEETIARWLFWSKPAVCVLAAGWTACASVVPVEPFEVPDGGVRGVRPIYVDADSARLIRVARISPERCLGQGEEWSLTLSTDTGRTLVRLHLDRLSGICLEGPITTVGDGPLGYVEVPGCTRVIQLSDSTIAVDNERDSVVLELALPLAVREVSRNPAVFTAPVPVPGEEEVWQFDDSQLNGNTLYFECYDPTRGILGGWEPVTLPEVTCLYARDLPQ